MPSSARIGTPCSNDARGVHLDFGSSVSMGEVAGTLELALLAAESLHGADRVQLDAGWSMDPRGRRVVIDTGTRAGRTLALIFMGFIRREFGSGAARVYRVRGAGDAGPRLAGAA